MESPSIFKARRVGWVPSLKTIETQYKICNKMPKMGAAKNMVTLLGHFEKSGAERPENIWEQVFGLRSEPFEK